MVKSIESKKDNNAEKTVFSGDNTFLSDDDTKVSDTCSLETSLDILSKELEREKKEKKLLQKIASSMLSLDDLLDEVLAYLQEQWGFTAFIIQIVDEPKHLLKCHRYAGIKIDAPEFEKALTKGIDLARPELSISSKVAIRQKLFYARKANLQNHQLLELDAKTLNYLNIKENLLVPIVDHGTTIGVLQLLSIDKELDLSLRQIREIRSFISSLSGTIRLLKNNYDSQCIKDEQQQIIDLVTKLGSTIDLKQTLKIFCDTVSHENDFDGYSVLLKSKNEESLDCKSISLPDIFSSMEGTYLGFHVENDGNNSYSKAFKLGESQTYYAADKDNYSKFEKHIFELWKFQSFLILPIKNNDQSYGVIAFFCQRRDVRQKDIINTQRLIPFLASRVEYSHDYDQIKSKEDVVNKSFEFNSSFLKFISEINTVATIEEIYKAFSDEILKRYKFDIASVFLIKDKFLDFQYHFKRNDSDKGYLDDIGNHFRNSKFPMNKDGGALVLAIRNKSTIFVPDTQSIKLLPMAKIDRDTIEKFPDTRTLLHIPIKKHGEIIGIYTLMSFEDQAQLNSEDIKIIEYLCSFMETVLVNANLYTQIGKQKDEIEQTFEELKNTQDKLFETERSRLDAMQRAVESAQAATEAKSGFLANMSHEIRTPLNAIIGLTELLLQTEQNHKQLDYTKKIFGSSKSLLGLINDILDFSKIEAGKLDIESTFFNLKSVTKRINDMFATKVRENNNKLSITVKDDVPLHLVGDPLRLSQVIINLTNNALKFTKDGNVDIEISLERQTYDEAKIKFEIHDTGTGISKDKISSLFESFTQADSSTTRQFGGTGLGLTISKSIVELMGGRIWAESELGKGSTFAFTIIFATSSEGVEAKLKNNTKGKKALIADDNEAIRVFLTYELQKIGMDVTTVASAELLINEYDKCQKYFPYDLIITDWRMPEMTGVELTRKIREDIGDKSTPIIMISAYHNDDVKQQSLGAGVNTWIPKPIKETELHSAISELFIDSDQVDDEIDSVNIAQAYEMINGARLLLVEDNFINQQVAQEMLQGIGLIVDLADNGIMALDALSKNKDCYDAILTDIQMPEMDGYTFCEELRKIDMFSDIPVIAMTADAINGVKDQCLKAGMNDYITKPVNYSELVQTLLKWIAPKGNRIDKAIDFIDDNGSKSQDNAQSISGLKLPGIDLKGAVERMAGNKKLAISVITSFANDFFNAPETVQSCLNNNEIEEAVRVIHTVKGLVKTFSTRDVIDVTLSLENAVKQGKNEIIPVLLSQFRSTLQPVFESANLLAEIDEVEHSKSSHQKVASNTNDQNDTHIKDQIFRLASYLKNNDFLAMDYLNEIRDGFDQEKFGEDLNVVQTKLSEFDFASALILLENIAEFYGVMDLNKDQRD